MWRPRRGVIEFVPRRGRIFGKKVEQDEIELFANEVAKPLQALTWDIAAAFDTQPVTGIDNGFKKHGYCAPGLNNSEGDIRWVNTVRDSETKLGGERGAMHPNIRGQAYIARQLLESIVAKECGSDRVAKTDAFHVRLCADKGKAWKSILKSLLDD